MKRALLTSAIIATVTACGTSADDGSSDEVTSPSSTPATTREVVEQQMEGDTWYQALTDDQQDLIHENSAGLCDAADEEITYGEVNGDQQSMTYTREMAMKLGSSGGVAAAGKGNEAAESARRFLLAYINEDCPEHTTAITAVLDEQYDAIFGTVLNERPHTS
ncbi:hypothetical protein ACFXKD_28325 [Nocardiopsis aegyptia]|uniref:hypothetical protein n=1 Tax=Nocardiopsis aegyptia TaxID=220378 RepID=UPI00367136FC